MGQSRHVWIVFVIITSSVCAEKKASIPWWKKAREKEKEAKIAEKPKAPHESSQDKGGSSKRKASTDPLVSSLTTSKRGKNAKKNAAIERYANLPDDVSDPTYNAKLISPFRARSTGGAPSGPPSEGRASAHHSAPEFPSWACAPGRIQQASRVVRPANTELKDTEGKPIHAHGGGFLAPGQGGGGHKRWWWYGESAKGNPHVAGVNAYSSSDLLNWKFEGSMINQKTILGKLRQLKSSSAFEVIRRNATAVVIVERPKVVYCPKTSKYVMWFHLDHRQERKPHYHWRLVAVATAEHPNGPFHLHHAFHPSGLPSLDISLYQLPADDNVGNKAHEAFLLRAIDNKYIGASKLRDDFLDVADPAVSILTQGRREAPALFRSNGVYRLLVTETDGWQPSKLHLLNGTKGLNNAAAATAAAATRKNGRLSPAQAPLFTETKSPCPPSVKSAFDSQVMAVIQHCDGHGKPYYIYVGDRWNVGPGKKGIAHAGYVWLPMATPNGSPVSMSWRSAWDLLDPFNTAVK